MTETDREISRSDEGAAVAATAEPPVQDEPLETTAAEEPPTEERRNEAVAADEPPAGEPLSEAATTDEAMSEEPRDGAAAADEPPAETTAGAGSASGPSDDAGEVASGTGAEPAPPAAEAPAVQQLRAKMEARESVRGKVIGWNKGGFHVVIDGVTTFCPHSEMDLGKVKAPKQYLDKDFEFKVLRIEDNGRRVVLSRTAVLRKARTERKRDLLDKVQAGATLRGRVASLTDFGAFVDLGGVQGLVHVSEISRERVADPSSVLTINQPVDVKVLKVEQGGKRISLSMKALEPDPWDGVADRFSVGSIVEGTVERTASFGAFVALEPGLTGLLPASLMNLPRGAQPGRAYHPGKKLSVQVMSIDPRRRRISLAPEGSQVEGSRSDFESYKKRQREGTSNTGFNALATAFQKLQDEPE